VEEIPARAACAAGPVAGDAVPETVDPTELLDVPPPPSADGGPFGSGSRALPSMDQLARALALVADDRGLGVQRRLPAQPVAALDQADGGRRPAEPVGDGGAGEALPSQRRDRRLRRLVQPGRADPRPRAAIAQPGRSLGGVPGPPLATVLEVTPNAAATLAMVQPSAKRRIISCRPMGVVLAL
jgi:hypothetical protein